MNSTIRAASSENVGDQIGRAGEPQPATCSGIVLERAALNFSKAATLSSQIGAVYQTVEAARARNGIEAISRVIPAGQRFVPTASSLTIGAVLSDEELRDLLRLITLSAAGEWIRRELGNSVACDADQAWVRRQYAPANYPQFHAPHGWHQDGALGFNFPAHPDGRFPPDALLEMVTCWITLVPCGVNSPGLELVLHRLEGLLAPVELADVRVRMRFAPEQFWGPAMEPGDALLFHGDILHRTHVTPAMTEDRTSIELRFFPTVQLPARLRADRLVVLD